MRKFARLSWGVLAFNVLVMAWGALVRATGSGAGCGSHWPLCDGEVVPTAPGTAKIIEFTHRATSGLAMLAIFALAYAGYRAFPRGDRVRAAVTSAAVFVSLEAVLGAGLVLFDLVAHNASMKRALSIALHLTNTFFLLASLTLTAWWAQTQSGAPLRRRGALPWLASIPLAAMILVGMSGAVAALGDTLFPVRSLAEGFAQDSLSGSHIFIRLRVWHPFFAVAATLIVLAVAAAARVMRPTPAVRAWSYTATALVALQVGAGLLNLALLAPVWMQLVHLVLADSVWIALVLLSASLLEGDALARPSVAPPLAREELARDAALR